MTRPLSGPDQTASNARAIAAEALPAPTTTVRPRTGAGLRCSNTREGSAAASAASNNARNVSPTAVRSYVLTRLFRLAKLAAISYRALRKTPALDLPQRKAGLSARLIGGDVA